MKDASQNQQEKFKIRYFVSFHRNVFVQLWIVCTDEWCAVKHNGKRNFSNYTLDWDDYVKRKQLKEISPEEAALII